ncbi:HNH endonuclease signature motif containing protein [Streptomyces sp. NPDC020719]|uniref:HNH endonuclease n=1 Tax=Streptomyces sp. NPDC020719 TaxID=3154896 RepID=UPI0033E769B8
MAQGRKAVPAELKRAVLVEAGHRCAIPTCRVSTTELAHIEPWRKVHEHKFENLIALCPTCHTRFDQGDIDRKAMLQYKANLGVINGRYGEVEQRVLALFAENPEINSIPMPAASDVIMMHLVKDGLFTRGLKRELGILIPNGANAVIDFAGGTQEFYTITEKGRELVARLASARSLD